MTEVSDSPFPEWGPLTAEMWSSFDPLNPLLADLWHGGRLPPSDTALWRAWVELAEPHRRQVFREREIAAAVLREESMWMQLPGLHGVGVGVRNLNGRSALAAVAFTEDSVEAVDVRYGIRQFLDVPSIVPGVVEASVPVVVELRQPPRPLAAAACQATSPGCPPGHQPVLRPGLRVRGLDEHARAVEGTLAGPVHRGHETLLLGSGHVFGKGEIRAGGQVVGDVCEFDQYVDAAAARPAVPWAIDSALPFAPVAAGPPLMPYSLMPVQYCGAKSGYQVGFVSEPHFFPTGAHRLGYTNRLTMTIDADQMDSGALVVTGQGMTSALPPGWARHTDPQASEGYTCAAVGLIDAGTLLPGGHKVAYATFIIDVLEALNVELGCAPGAGTHWMV